jgi:hypothetical protein
MPSLETAARSLKVMPITAPIHSDVMGDAFTAAHRAPIISAAARNNVPAVYGVSESADDERGELRHIDALVR